MAVRLSASGSVVTRTLHDAANHFAREAARGQKANLSGTFGHVGSHLAELARPDFAGAGRLAVFQLPRRIRRQCQAVLGQLSLNAQIAEARSARVNAAFDESFLAEIAVRLQPV